MSPYPERERTNPDHLIKAHALALDMTLVTSNERDFAACPDLQIENRPTSANVSHCGEVDHDRYKEILPARFTGAIE